MSGWKKISDTHYSYRGFNIYFTTDIIDRRAVDVMRATKEVMDEQGKKEKISFKATGDSFQEVKLIICRKIDDYFNSLE